MSVRATTAFNNLVGPLGVTVSKVDFEGDAVVLVVRARRQRLFCACGWSTVATYDRSVRRWRHLDAFGAKVFLEAEIRRLNCGRCARVVTEEVSWARHGARHTLLFDEVVGWWCQRSDRSAVAAFWRLDWASVTSIAARVVAAHLDDSRFEGLSAIGVDEISWSKGHRYLTIVVDHRKAAVIWVGDGKDSEVLGQFYDLLGPRRAALLTAVSMDMGRAYESATKAHTGATICWDPFHVVKLLNRAIIDTITWSRLTRQGLPMTRQESSDLRWAMLKNPADHTSEQAEVLARHRRARHACWRAQELKEDFRGLYQLADPSDASLYLTRWLRRVSRCRIPPMVKAAHMIRSRQEGILAAVELGLANSRLEGINSKIRMINHRGYGHHRVETLTAMIYLCCSGIRLELPW